MCVTVLPVCSSYVHQMSGVGQEGLMSRPIKG